MTTRMVAIIIGAISAVVLAAAGFFVIRNTPVKKAKRLGDKIVKLEKAKLEAEKAVAEKAQKKFKKSATETAKAEKVDEASTELKAEVKKQKAEEAKTPKTKAA